MKARRSACIIGLGESGYEAAMLLARKSWSVRASDSAADPGLLKRAEQLKSLGVRVETGRHSKGFTAGCETVVVSPGIAPDNPLVVEAEKAGIPVISEIELAYRMCKCPVVAVTGSNGKTTTTALLARILEKAGRKVEACGNIGKAFAGVCSRMDEKGIVVLEVSSFQLERIVEFRPRVAVMLNLSPNHLDRYKDMEEYSAAKQRIFRNQASGDTAVLNYDDARVKHMKTGGARKLYFSTQSGVNGVCVEDDLVVFNNGKRQAAFPRAGWKMRGRHNLANVLAASAAAYACGAGWEEISSAVAGFVAPEHRFEDIGEYRGILFVNDSKATTPEATIAALEACERRVVLIAGGKNKGLDCSVARSAVKDKVKSLILIGAAADEIYDALSGTVPARKAKDLDEAVEASFREASPGEMVLLSPMCASFDMFSNFEERGRAFKKAVLKCAKTEESCSQSQ